MENDYRKLTRSTSNRMICGVCGGLGEYLNVDPTVIRVIWAFCAFASVGTGALVYLIAAVVIPEDINVV
ncbi:MAG: PspC domain-containing protein [Lachnospiraceae bacterium]|nr:PspC domain-containing protein [Lachnospiraceae bacterium]